MVLRAQQDSIRKMAATDPSGQFRGVLLEIVLPGHYDIKGDLMMVLPLQREKPDLFGAMFFESQIHLILREIFCALKGRLVKVTTCIRVGSQPQQQ